MEEEVYTIFVENKEVATGLTRDYAFIFAKALFINYWAEDILTIQITREFRKKEEPHDN